MRTASIFLIIASLTLPACTQLKGIVEESPGRPAITAALSVGRPGGISGATIHRVDAKGRFDFWIFTIDEHKIYLFDQTGDPQTTLRRIDRSEFGGQMYLTIPSGIRRGDLIHEK